MASSSTDTKKNECPTCPTGRMEEGTTSLTFEGGPSGTNYPAPSPVVVVVGVPAEVCDVCGEALVDSETAEEVNELLKDVRYLWNRFPERLDKEGVTMGGEPGEEGGIVRIDYDSTEMPVGRKHVG